MADRPSLYLRLVSPGAFLVALGWLIAQVGWPDAVMACMGGATDGGGAVLALAAMSAIALSARALASDDEDERRRRWDEVLLAPCVLAPLAVIAPWVLAPGRIGVVLGDLPFFVAWLTVYPTLGGINHEVLLGIGAMLGACAMPAFFAFYVLQARAPRPGVTIVFAALHLVAYVPVLLALDLDLVLSAPIIAWIGLWPSDEGAPWLALCIAAGALLRGLATVAMIGFVVRTMRRRAQRVVWEMGESA